MSNICTIPESNERYRELRVETSRRLNDVDRLIEEIVAKCEPKKNVPQPNGWHGNGHESYSIASDGRCHGCEHQSAN